MMAAGWSNEATKVLITVWGEQNIQNQLDGVVRNKVVYEKVSATLQERGYEFSWKQCRTKVKNLTQTYRKVKDNNNRSGSGRIVCPFYEELNAILGTRAASEPPLLLDSGSGPSTQDSEDHPADIFGSLPPTPIPDPDTELNQAESLTTDSSSHSSTSANTTPQSVCAEPSETAKSSTSSVRLGKRKMRNTQHESTYFLERLAELEEAAERREEERETRRLEFEERLEERRREREQNHEERMTYMFLAIMNQFGHPSSYSNYNAANYPPTPFPNSFSPPSHVPQSPNHSYPNNENN